MPAPEDNVTPAPEAAFARVMARLFPTPPAELGIAVSGGSDSTALLFLTANWASDHDCTLYVLTVDHSLRPEAADEAEKVARHCRALAVTHAILRWEGWDGQGNLQDAARRARHGLIERWRGGLTDVLMGHTMDDQAETVLMRLSRGSGVEGLAGIAESAWIAPPDKEVRISDAEGLAPPQVEARDPGFTVHRPLLEFRRKHLRDWLRSLGVTWSDDPSNDKTQFDRVRARRLLQGGTAGLTVEGLAATAARMARARQALAKRAQSAAQAIAKVEGDAVRLRRIGLLALDPDTRLRLTAQALMWVASADYRPREKNLRSGSINVAIAVPCLSTTLPIISVQPCRSGGGTPTGGVGWKTTAPQTIE